MPQACGAHKCDKFVCKSCYITYATTRWREDPLEDTDLVFHSKACLKKGKSYSHRVNEGSLLWSQDGKLGPDDPNTSMAILIDWLRTEGNYAKFRGGPASQGRSKKGVCEEISKKIRDGGCICTRTAKSCLDKIQNIKNEYTKTNNWMNNTGQGLEGTGTFEEAVTKICPYFYEVEKNNDALRNKLNSMLKTSIQTFLI